MGRIIPSEPGLRDCRIAMKKNEMSCISEPVWMRQNNFIQIFPDADGFVSGSR